VVGTGLGRSIVKAIVKLHNYDYGVNSKLGEGSTFWFAIRTESQSEQPVKLQKAAQSEPPKGAEQDGTT